MNRQNNTSSRQDILERIRAGRPAGQHPLPEIPQFTVPGNPVDNFCLKLMGFHGQAFMFDNRRAALDWLVRNVGMNEKKVYSALPDFEGNVDPLTLDDDPHRAVAVDICVAQGEYGVGEMGSVWVTDRSLGLAAAALLCTDLYLLLDRRNILPDLHRAYAAIKPQATAYGSFFTGPSATADIEAVHITGAQGEISLTVLLY